MRFFTAFLLTVSIMLLGASTMQAQTVDFIASDEVFTPGATQEVSISVGNNFVDVTGIQFDLNWDPDVLEFVSIQDLHTDPGSAPDDDLNFITGAGGNFGLNNVDDGTLTFLWDDPDVQGETIDNSDPDTNNLLFTIAFRALGCSGGSSTVTFTDASVFIAPATQGTFNNDNGSVSVSGANPAPTFTSVSPDTGDLGEDLTSVTFNGSGFLECAAPDFDDPNITASNVVVAADGNSLTADVSIGNNATVGTGTVVVSNGGTDSGTQDFSVEYPAPTITNVNPGSQAPGTTGDIVITGTNFVDDGGTESTVAFNGFTGGDITINGSPTFQNCSGKLCTQITVNITVSGGATPTTGTVEVTNPTPGGGSDDAPFSTGNPEPTINTVTPNDVDRGDTGVNVTIEGAGFVDGVTDVSFSNPGISIVSGPTVNGAGDEITLTIDVDPGADTGTGTVTVSNPTSPPPGGDDSADFTVSNPAPDLTAVNPNVGDIGQTLNVVLTGTNFINDGGSSSTVSFSGSGITINNTTFQSCTGNLCDQITVNISITSGAGLRDVTVTNPGPGGGNDTLTNAFLVNTPPVAVDDPNEETDSSTPVIIDVLDNDNDADGDDLDIISVSNPPGGTAVITGTAPNETITYTPDGGFAGEDTFTYTISDNVGTTTSTATVTVFVDAMPTAVDDDALTAVNEDILIDVLDNDLSPDGETLTIVNATNPPNGTVQIIGDEIRYTPDNNFIGTDTFDYTIEDENSNQDTGTVTVEVVGNRAPVADSDGAVTDEDTSVLIPVLVNDTDPDGDPLSLDGIDNAPSNGTATIVGDQIRYTPNTGFVGTDTFTYIVTDPDGLTDIGEVTVRVRPRDNTAPVASDDAATTGVNTAVDIDVLANDTDPEGDPLTIDAVSDPDNGTAVIDGDMVTYTPDNGFTGTDTFTYTISDDRGGEDTATVTVTVVDNGAPVANDDTATTPTNTAVDIDVLANDTDPDGDDLTITATSTPSNGTATTDGDMVTYTPDSGFTGTDTFTYTISDGTATDTATVTVTVGNDVTMFTADLSGENEVPPNTSDDDSSIAAKVQSGTGTVTATLNGNTLTVSGTFDNLESDFNADIAGGAHIHRGFAGQNGPVVFPLNVTLDADNRGGTLSGTFTLTNAQVTDLQDRRYYVNIHSVDLPAGSVRGQLTASNVDATFRVALSGRAEVPANASMAVGGAIAELTGNTLVVSGAFSGLESNFNASIAGGAHIHQADIGENGGIVFNLTTTVDGDNRGGVFDPTENTFTLSNAQVDALEDGLFYFNIHTADLTGGELRGQVLPEESHVFEFYLSGQNEVPAIETGASGGGIAVLSGNTLRVAGSFADLESDFNAAIQGGAHLHGAMAGENGGILFNLDTTLDNDNRGGTFAAANNEFTLTGDQVDMLTDGGIYVNVHTVDQGGGELRGQVLVSTNVAPSAVAIAAPTDGASIDVAGDPSTPFNVTWDPASDANGNEVVYRWQLATGDDFSGVVFETIATESGLSATYGEIAALLTSNGIAVGQSITLYHRVVTSDGSFSTEGDGASVTLTRGAITAVGDGPEVPQGFTVHSNYPNPFNPSTTITVDLPETANVHVEVYDMQGRRMLSTPARSMAAGNGQALNLDASALPSGTYLYRVLAKTATDTLIGSGRMVLVK